MRLAEKIARILHKHAEIDFYDARNCDDVAGEIVKAVVKAGYTPPDRVRCDVINGRFSCCGNLPTTGHDKRCPALRPEH